MTAPRPGTLRRQVFDALHEARCGEGCRAACKFAPSDREVDAAAEVVRAVSVKQSLTVKSRQRRRRYTETRDFGMMTTRMIKAFGRRCQSADKEELALLFGMAKVIDEVISETVEASKRDQEFSWSYIGAAAGVNPTSGATALGTEEAMSARNSRHGKQRRRSERSRRQETSVAVHIAMTKDESPEAIEQAKRLSHDALVAGLGSSRRSGIAWKISTPEDTPEHLRELLGATDATDDLAVEFAIVDAVADLSPKVWATDAGYWAWIDEHPRACLVVAMADAVAP